MATKQWLFVSFSGGRTSAKMAKDLKDRYSEAGGNTVNCFIAYCPNGKCNFVAHEPVNDKSRRVAKE